jgi:EAL and modified HD-GYP domain-containing signal transduction protein
VQEVYVGRQPIFDRSLSVLGYELLFRHGPDAAFATSAGDRATGRVIVNTFAELGLDRMVGSKTAFINLTRPFLVGTLPLPFSSSDVVLEILETIAVDDDLIAGLQRLMAAGYSLAIDDYRADDYERTQKLLPYVTYVKVDVLSQTDDELAACVEQCRPHRAHLIAERVEDHDTMRRCIELGFQYFQGYLLGRPAVVSSPGLAPTTVTCMELLSRLSKPDVTFDELVEIVRVDLGLSYRLLRAVNSAAAGLVRPVSSVREALVMLGHRQLRAWILLMVVADASDVVEEQLTSAMTRARMCELLTQHLPTVKPDVAFFGGLLSSLDFLLNMPMSEVVERLPLEDTISRALVSREGDLGRLIDTVTAYEVADLDALASSPIELSDLAPAYLNAIAWSMSVTAEAISA